MAINSSIIDNPIISITNQINQYKIVLMFYNEWCYAFGFACTTVSIKHLTNCKTDV